MTPTTEKHEFVGDESACDYYAPDSLGMVTKQSTPGNQSRSAPIHRTVSDAEGDAEPRCPHCGHDYVATSPDVYDCRVQPYSDIGDPVICGGDNDCHTATDARDVPPGRAWVQPNAHSGLGSGYFYKNTPVTESIEYNLTTTTEGLAEALREMVNSAIDFDDARISYVGMQVDRNALAAARSALAKWKGKGQV